MKRVPEDSKELPEDLKHLVDDILRLANLDQASASRVRSDLEQHLHEGLSQGRTVRQLVQRFGDPESVGPILGHGPTPPSTVRNSGRGDGLFASLTSDLKHAIRGLAQAPNLAATAVLVLALGVGANAVVFTVLNELLLRPLPVEDPSTLVDVWADIPGGNSFLGVSWQDYVAYRDDNTVLEGLVAFTGQRLRMGDDQGPVVATQLVSPGYFEMLGIPPTLGRTRFSPDAGFGDPSVVVLSHAQWQESFASDPTIVGQTIRFDGIPATVIGVGPEGFAGNFIGFPMDAWIPITSAAHFIAGFDPNDRMQKPFEMIGRLRVGVSPAAASEALNVIAQGLERAYPDINRGHRVGVTSTTGMDHSLQAGVTAFVMILSAISGLVLIIACLNVGSVLLVRAMSRDRELAVRVALGASKARVLQQLLTESVLLAGMGAAAAIFVAVRLNAALVRTLTTVSTGNLGLELSIDWRVLSLTAAATIVAAILATMAPAFHVLRKHPAEVLRGRGGPSRSSARIRSILVVGQVAVSVTLVIATGLFVRALAVGAKVDPGFDADQLATFSVSLPPESAPQYAQLERDLAESLLALPNIQAVTRASAPPIGVARSPMSIEVPGVQPPPDGVGHIVDARIVTSRYLETVGITLRSGRDFTEADDQDASRVAVVSETFADRFWPGRQAVGQIFTAGMEEVRVVGVAADARYVVQDDSPDPLLYLSRAGRTQGSFQITYRAPIPLQAVEDVQRVVSELIPGHSVVQPRVSRAILNAVLLPQRMGALIVGAMGLAALFLATVGVYGLIQFTVARDTHELGVRLALGGGRRDLLVVVLRKGLRLVLIGTTIGVVIALLTAPTLGTFLAGVSPSDPITYGSVIACFTLVSLVASWLPARRAMRIDAVEALRGE